MPEEGSFSTIVGLEDTSGCLPKVSVESYQKGKSLMVCGSAGTDRLSFLLFSRGATMNINSIRPNEIQSKGDKNTPRQGRTS
jgi:hypothetical protein